MTQTDNAKYVKRGAGLIVKYNPEWEKDLKDANCHKEKGAPFLYAEGMIMAAAALRTAFMIQYRQLSGMFEEMLKGADSPCYATIFRRIQKLDVDIAEHVITVRDKPRNLVMIADATGLKQHNRGEWICKKWKVRRGFVKIHLMVDADTKQMLAVSVTSDAVGDSTELPTLLEEATKNIKEEQQQELTDGADAVKNIKEEQQQQELTDGADAVKNIKEEQQQQELTDGADAVKIPNMLADGISPMTLLDTGANPDTPGKILLADGAYGSRKNVAECHKRGIKPLIRLLTSCTAKGKGTGDKWGMLVRWQLGGGPEEPVGSLSKEERQENLRYWKSTVGFGSRWIVEIVISSIKRMFGECVMALKWSNIVQEVKLRIWLYNKWIAEAVAAM